MSTGREEWKAHRAADAQHVGEFEEPLDDAELVGDLGAAEDRHQRPVGTVDDRLECAHLALHQPSRGAREPVGDPLRARVGAVRGAERVVHVHVGELGERRHQLRVVARLSRLVADVLEHQHLARGEPLGELSHLRSGDGRRERHRRAGQLLQAVGHRPHRQRRVQSLRPAQMRDEHEPRAATPELRDRLELHPDPGIVGHLNRAAGLAPAERHVEIGAQQNASALHVQLVDCSQRIGHRDRLQLVSGDCRRAATRSVRRRSDRGPHQPMRSTSRRNP